MSTTPQKCEFESNTPGQIVYEIKQEMIKCEESNIDHDLMLEKNVQFCSTLIKEELENTSEVKAMYVGDINEDVTEYVKCESELLTTHCDLPTLKNENTEDTDCLAGSCDREEDESTSNPLKNNANVLNLKRKQYICSKKLMDCTPPEVRQAVDAAAQGLVPEKSKHRYLKAIELYRKWCEEKKVKNIGSEGVLLAYFGEHTRQKKPSTLWAMYSMIRTMLEIEEKTDISKHGKLLAFLKRENVGFRPKKSNVFSKKNIEDFLKKAPNNLLPIKVALIIGVSGACRTDELVKMKMLDVAFFEENISIEIPETHKSRSFLITDPVWLKIIRDYTNLRKNIEIDRFFVQLRGGIARNKPIGHNTIANFPQQIATFLNLENCKGFTGHTFRRTAATLLANSGATVL